MNRCSFVQKQVWQQTCKSCFQFVFCCCWVFFVIFVRFSFKNTCESRHITQGLFQKLFSGRGEQPCICPQGERFVMWLQSWAWWKTCSAAFPAGSLLFSGAGGGGRSVPRVVIPLNLACPGVEGSEIRHAAHLLLRVISGTALMMLILVCSTSVLTALSLILVQALHFTTFSCLPSYTLLLSYAVYSNSIGLYFLTHSSVNVFVCILAAMQPLLERMLFR